MSYKLVIAPGNRYRYRAKIQGRFKGLWLTVNSEEFNTRKECRAFVRMVTR